MYRHLLLGLTTDDRQSSVLSGSGYSSGWCPHRRRSKDLAISRTAVESGPWLYS